MLPALFQALHDQVYSEMCISRAKEAGHRLPDSLSTLSSMINKQRRTVQHIMEDILYRMENTKMTRKEAEVALPELQRSMHAYYNHVLLWTQTMLQDIVFAARKLFTEQEWRRTEQSRADRYLEGTSMMQLLGMLMYHTPPHKRRAMGSALHGLSRTMWISPAITIAVRMYSRSFIRPLLEVQEMASVIINDAALPP